MFGLTKKSSSFPLHDIKTHEVKLGDMTFSFETGKFAHLADGAVLVRHGEITLLATAGMSSNPRQGIDFFPLMCEFQSRYYASGKLRGSRFVKREGRPSDNDILVSRMMDRPLRPMFAKGITNDVQLIATLLQTDGLRSVAPTAITAASMAVQLSGMPIEAPVSAVRVGMRENGDFFLDPTYEEAATGKLDLVIAGTEDAIMMVEAGADLISDEEMIAAFEFAHTHIKALCKAQKDFRGKHKIVEKTPLFRATNETAEEVVSSVLSDSDFASIGGATKAELKKSVKIVEEKLITAVADRIEAEEFTKGQLLGAMGKKSAEFMRKKIFEKGIRLDGRKTDEIRPLYTEVSLFPRVHGSGFFQRGDTQALSMVTLGGPSEELLVDDADRPELKQAYFHHYNFPPYSVGEVRPLRGTGRREIGHGALAERALRYVMPTKADGFPYTVRVVSEILACNGSSSMASVCGSTLSLMDAGVPLKAAISGIAMGLVTDDAGNYQILTDIQGAEDFDGDMDLKVCGSADGLTSLQMDIKLKGLDMKLIREALEKARKARKTILENMLKTIPAPREEMNEFAPRVLSMKIDPDDIRVVIGKGGETIQGLCADHSVKIDIDDDGLVMISGVGESAEKAQMAIKDMTYKAQVGDVFDDAIVKKIMDFGAFVEFLPGKEALLHVSEIAEERVENVSDYLKEGQKIKVKIAGVDDRSGKLRLSMKQA